MRRGAREKPQAFVPEAKEEEAPEPLGIALTSLPKSEFSAQHGFGRGRETAALLLLCPWAQLLSPAYFRTLCEVPKTPPN